MGDELKTNSAKLQNDRKAFEELGNKMAGDLSWKPYVENTAWHWDLSGFLARYWEI